MFFDKHPEFLETSTTAADKGRLNLRHLAIIKEHEHILRGARVLDIASHDGRWSFAALEAGAEHVLGIEGRDHLAANARATMARKGVDESRYEFQVGDVHDVLTAGIGKVDVVMCLGFLYHTLRYPELFAGIRATGAKYVIVDSMVVPSKRAVIKLTKNPEQFDSMAIADRFSYQGKTLVGVPSAKGIETMLRTFNYWVLSRPDWGRIRAEHPRIRSAEQYGKGNRVTMLAISREDEAPAA